ncbi:MAG: hypothetical protein JXR77_11265, partial [Lentisphaeria bacterium]|nr:hypothetical protein [Lentisphaeria bacterium]
MRVPWKQGSVFRVLPRAVLPLCAGVCLAAGEGVLVLPLGDGPEAVAVRQFAVVRGWRVVASPPAAAPAGGGVLWLHQGDAAQPEGVGATAAGRAAIRAFVEAGNGLLLTGAAFALVHDLGAEPLAPRRGGPGDDANPAAIVPVLPNHPAFAGLRPVEEAIPFSDRGYPAFADFHGSGGPSRGMLLGRSPAGVENPLVEYALGKGRIVALGWRLPHYGYPANPHRKNLERLTDNLAAYLARPERW